MRSRFGDPAHTADRGCHPGNKRSDAFHIRRSRHRVTLLSRVHIAHRRPRRTLPLTRTKPVRGEAALSIDRILSEAEMTDVHGGVFGKQLATSYRDIFGKAGVLDIGNNLAANKLNYLMNQDFWSGFHFLPKP